MSYYRGDLVVWVGGTAVACLLLVSAAGQAQRRTRRAGLCARGLWAGAALLVPVVVALARSSSAPTYVGGVQWVPGRTIAAMLHQPNRAIAVANLLGNIVLFVPVGFVAVTLVRLRVAHALLLAAGTSAAIEFVQYMTHRGSADVDDVLLNALGTLVGAAVGFAASSASPRTRAIPASRERDPEREPPVRGAGITAASSRGPEQPS